MRLAVIITTYNRSDALETVLNGYMNQDERDFEIIIADDGSSDETHNVIEAFRVTSNIPIKHVWHEDEGFRAATIRNRAIAAVSADYILFTDGDCVPRPTFVSTHRRLAERGWFLAGNRILLSERLTNRLIQNKLSINEWTLFEYVTACVKKDLNRCHPLLSLPLGPVRKMKKTSWAGVMTCNLSVWRDDIVSINGFDESFHGWGLEDSDLVIRLLRYGVFHKSLRFAATLFHLWHGENDRTGLEKNRRRLEELIKSDKVNAVRGVSQYL